MFFRVDQIPLSSLEVSVPEDGSNYSGDRRLDFSIISPVRSCTFRCSAPAERDAWVAAMRRAVREHHDRRATFANAASFEKVNNAAIDIYLFFKKCLVSFISSLCQMP